MADPPRDLRPDDELTPDELSLDALTAGVSVFQRRKGHRFSSDDTVTAWVALQVCPQPSHVLDLGCGLGSVLLHLAWSVPTATLAGVEAQPVSFDLLRRNIAHNRLDGRVTVTHGDLRDPAVLAGLGGPFDLITGTPPYFPVSTASDSLDEQRAYARIEYRGGIEAYVAAAAGRLSDDGWFVVCGDSDAAARLDRSAQEHGFAVRRRYTVIPRAGRAPLFSVWALHRRPDVTDEIELTLRDAAGERTEDARVLRAFSGFAENGPTDSPTS